MLPLIQYLPIYIDFSQYQSLRQKVLCSIPKPYCIIYLAASPEQCSERLLKRGRVSGNVGLSLEVHRAFKCHAPDEKLLASEKESNNA